MNFTIVPLDSEHYDDWDTVCRTSKNAWFWHTTRWLEYTLAYNPSLKSSQCSFLLYNNSRAVAAVPLMVESHDYGEEVIHEFSFGGGWLPSPVCVDGLSAGQKKQVFRTAFDHVFALAEENGVGRIRYRSNPFLHLESGLETLVPVTVRFGFTSYILPTQIIDVRKDPVDLLKEMRKGHRSDIRRADKKLEGLVISHENASLDLFAFYQDLHAKAAGRQTRPVETFKMMYEWIRNGYAILIGAKLKGRFVSFAYVNIFKDCAYYSSACNDPEVENLPLAHFVQWLILNWLHEHAFRYYEVGWQSYSSTEVLPATEKEVAISRFKRGFGGVTVPIVLSEKFVLRKDYISMSQDRTLRYAETLPGSFEPYVQLSQEVLP